jgi:hypothetical protein
MSMAVSSPKQKSSKTFFFNVKKREKVLEKAGKASSHKSKTKRGTYL